MAFCGECSQIDSSKLLHVGQKPREDGYFFQKSYDEITESSRKGCPLCTLITEAAPPKDKVGRWSRPDESSPLHLAPKSRSGPWPGADKLARYRNVFEISIFGQELLRHFSGSLAAYADVGESLKFRMLLL
jgi:hypothetical protein